MWILSIITSILHPHWFHLKLLLHFTISEYNLVIKSIFFLFLSSIRITMLTGYKLPELYEKLYERLIYNTTMKNCCCSDLEQIVTKLTWDYLPISRNIHIKYGSMHCILSYTFEYYNNKNSTKMFITAPHSRNIYKFKLDLLVKAKNIPKKSFSSMHNLKYLLL